MFSFILFALLLASDVVQGSWGGPDKSELSRWRPENGGLSDFQQCSDNEGGRCDCRGIFSYGRGCKGCHDYAYAYATTNGGKEVCGHWGVFQHDPSPGNRDKGCHCASVYCNEGFKLEIQRSKTPGNFKCIDIRITEVNGRWVRGGSINQGGDFTYTRSVTNSRGETLTRAESSSFSLAVGVEFSIGGEWLGGSFGGSITATASQSTTMSTATSNMLTTGESWALKVNCKDVPGKHEYIWQWQERTKLATGDLGPVMNSADVLCIAGEIVPKCPPFHCADENCTQCLANRREVIKVAIFKARALFVALAIVALVAGIYTCLRESRKSDGEEYAAIVKDALAA